MKRRFALTLLLGFILVVGAAPSASAHGEASQEAFLRMQTVGWLDVEFSDTTVQQGDPVTITGTAKLMDQWPDNLAAGDPSIGYINVIAPGPVVVLKERTVNGVSNPSRIEIEKGDYYDFEMTFVGRIPGRWHIHPAFAVKGAGTVLGPGEFVTVEENPAGFTNDVTLYNGKTVNLENYGLVFVWGWQVLTLLIGVAWMLYWTVPSHHRTVANLAVTSQIPLNDDGVNVGLNSQKDHRVVNLFALGTALLLVAAFAYQAFAYPVKIPQQVVQFAPPQPTDPPADFASARPVSANFNQARDALSMELEVTNSGTSPMQLTEFGTSTLSFVDEAAGGEAGAGEVGTLTVEPSGEVAPGETTTMTVTAQSPTFVQEHLIPIGEAELTVAGILKFESDDGDRSFVEVRQGITPQF
jgi:methane/ammonia monooxygenase subunit B